MGFFFFGVDFSAGSAADAATPDVRTVTAETWTGLVPPALGAGVLAALSLLPPEAFPMPNATANATIVAATTIPI